MSSFTIASTKAETVSTKKRRRGREVLNEEDYIHQLTNIIRRDYFPEGQALEQQLLTHESKNDGNNDIVSTLSDQSQKQSNDTFIVNTGPTYDELSTNDSLTFAPPRTKETLTDFHARATTEDNAYFAQEQQVELEAVRQRRRDFYFSINNDRAGSAKDIGGRASPQLLLASDEFNPPSQRPKFSSANEGENVFFFTATTDANFNCLNENNDEDSVKLLTNGSIQTKEIPHQQNKQHKQKLLLAEKKIEPRATRFSSQILPTPVKNYLEASDTSLAETEYYTDTESVPSNLSHSKVFVFNPPSSQNLNNVMQNSSKTDDDMSISHKSFSLPEPLWRDRALNKAQQRLEKTAKRFQSAGSSLKSVKSSLSTRTLPTVARSSNGAFGAALRQSYMPQSRSRSGRRHHNSKQKQDTASSVNSRSRSSACK